MDHAAVIDSFGGPADFAVAIGIKDSHARTMKARNSIDPVHWPKVVAAALARSLPGITYESLTLVHANRAKGEPARAAS